MESYTIYTKTVVPPPKPVLRRSTCMNLYHNPESPVSISSNSSTESNTSKSSNTDNCKGDDIFQKFVNVANMYAMKQGKLCV